VQNCNLINSGNFDILAAACNDPSTVIDAEDNFWVATDSATIADEHIYDNDDDNGSPVVDFVPFLMEEVTGSVEGVVYDEEMNPIAGVDVSVEGTSISGSTNESGEYSLTGLETDYHNVLFEHLAYRDTTVEGLFVSIGNTATLDLIMGIPCPPYVVGDFNGSGALNIADIIDSYSRLKTGLPEPYLFCECPPGSENILAVGMDVNNTCLFNIADIITAYSKLKLGTPELIPCEDCPPPGR
jgi:hypothetical protein